MLSALGHVSPSASVSVPTLVDSRMCQMGIIRHLRAPLPSIVIEEKVLGRGVGVSILRVPDSMCHHPSQFLRVWGREGHNHC